MRGLLLGLILLLLPGQMVSAAGFDHRAWDQLLQQHVVATASGHSTEVDYHGFLEDRKALQAYLQQLARVGQHEFDSWTTDHQLAFLINAYNAWTVELILSGFPGIESIKELGSFFQSPWKKKIVDLFGERVSLDHLEHELIRGSGRYQEPRIHFAVNCASVGCPALRREAYRGDKLETQLEEAATSFLADQSRNRFTSSGKLEVSAIFKWYREDFATGWRGATSLSRFLALYHKALGVTPETRARLEAERVDIVFLDYDWRLNGLRR